MTHFLNFYPIWSCLEEGPTLSVYSFYFHYDYYLHWRGLRSRSETFASNCKYTPCFM